MGHFRMNKWKTNLSQDVGLSAQFPGHSIQDMLTSVGYMMAIE